MLYLIGLGLCDAKDITVRGLEIVKTCHRVFLENYTSILTDSQIELEEFYGKKIELAFRDLVEEESDEILKDAQEKDVALLVIGDPFGATTHIDIVLRAIEKGIPYQVIHNASIISAVGCCGLQLYSFGETVSIPLWTDTWKPDSFYDKILTNRSRGLHTLCLLDIKVREPTPESLLKKKKDYLPPTFMTINIAAKQLLEIIKLKQTNGLEISNHCCTETTKCIGLARVGSPNQKLIFCSLKEMKDVDLGKPLHSLIVPGNLQILEKKFLDSITNPLSTTQNIVSTN